MRGARDASAAPLLERKVEVARLEAGVLGAHRGEGSLILVEGEPGIGKTRLLSSAVEMAGAAGLGVLRARGIEVEREVAFGVVRQLLERTLGAVEGEELAELLEGPAALSAAAFDVGVGASAASAWPDAGVAVMHGIYWLIANMTARGPLALVVDDAHWSDIRSLRTLAYLGRRLDGLSAVVIVAARPTAEDAPGLAEIRGDRLVARLRPKALTLAGTASLIARLDAVGVAPDAVARAHHLTGGNPFLVVELVRMLAQPGAEITAAGLDALGESTSASLANAVMLRLGDLGGQAVALARAVAVLGDDAELAHLCPLSQLERPAAVAAARRLVAAHILADVARPRFVHPLLGAAVYRDMTALECALAHERAAAVLERFAVAPGRIAAHLLLSPPDGNPDVVERLRAAARDALGKGAPVVATSYLRRALAEPPPEAARSAVLLELGQAELEQTMRRAPPCISARRSSCCMTRPAAPTQPSR